MTKCSSASVCDRDVRDLGALVATTQDDQLWRTEDILVIVDEYRTSTTLA